MPDPVQDVTPESVRALIDGSGTPKEVKRKAWDAFASTTDPEKFRKSLDGLPLSRTVKGQLWDMKSSLMQREVIQAPQAKAGGKPTLFRVAGKVAPESTAGKALDVAGRTLQGVEDAGKGLVIDTPKAVYHAGVDPVTEEEQARHSGAHRGPGLAAARLIVDPMREEHKKRDEAMRQGHTSEAVGHELAGDVPLVGPMASHFGERAGSGDIAGAVGEGATLALLPKLGKLMKELPGEFLSKYRPSVVDIQGTKFIVPVSEASELPMQSTEAIKQAKFKKAGVGAQEWEKIDAYNQKAAREVIQNIARNQSGIGAVPDSPAGAAGSAGTHLIENKAVPMYKALDAVIQASPRLRVISRNMSSVVQTAMKKAEKYGAPAMAKGMTAPGLRTPPLETYMKARTFLRDMAFKTSETNPIISRNLYSAVDEMDAGIEKAMKSSGVPDMYDNWKEAQRLYAKGKAFERVGDALAKASDGAPADWKPQGMATRHPTIKSGTLRNQLQKLDEHGDLERSFGKDGADALKQVAYVLDKQASANLPAGETAVLHSIHTALANKLYRNYMVKVMTTPKAARAILDLAKAKSYKDLRTYSLVLNAAFQQGAQVQPPPGAQQTSQ